MLFRSERLCAFGPDKGAAVRALVTDSDGPRLITDFELPEVGRAEALVRIEHAGLSPMELAAVAGRIEHTGVIGHELVGTVEKLGTRVAKSPLLRKRVVASPDVACGSCDLCRKRLSVHCRNRRVIGLSQHDGSLADYIVLPIRNLTEVRADLDPQLAVLAPAVADAVHVAHMALVEKQTYVTVLGDGAAALVAA